VSTNTNQRGRMHRRSAKGRVVIVEGSRWPFGRMEGRDCYIARWRDGGSHAGYGDSIEEAVDALAGVGVT
jgi:hypothetical protein